MAPCEFDKSGPVITITFSNPQSVSGAFEGIAVLNGTYVGNQGDGTFESFGTAFFAGEVEGCGSGTVNFDYTSSGTINEDGSNSFDHDTYTIVPGGTLAVTGGYEQSAEETPNDVGTSNGYYTAAYSCDEVAAAEGDAEDTADDAEEQAEDTADDGEAKADEKDDELEAKADA